MMLLVKNLMCFTAQYISRLNIHYYHNRRYKSYIISLKAPSPVKVWFLRDWVLIEFCILFFMIKYSKFTSNIGQEILSTHFVKIPTIFKKVGGGCYNLPVSSNVLSPTVIKPTCVLTRKVFLRRNIYQNIY